MSDYYKMADTIIRITICSWCLTSLGLPCLTTIYIGKLGKTVGLECVDENCTIVNKYPNCESIVPYYWMPKFTNATDPSARTLDIYT